jgi:hypothetical protein
MKGGENVKLNYNVSKEQFNVRMGSKKSELIKLLDEFANREEDFVELVFSKEEYRNLKAAYNSVYDSVKRFQYSFRVHMYNGKLYLDKKK